MIRPEIAFVCNGGGTDLRLGVASSAGVLECMTVPTPTDPDLLFRTIGTAALQYMQQYPEITHGAITLPGPVRQTANGLLVGPFENIPGLGAEPFYVADRIKAECSQLSGFATLALNDAEAETHGAPTEIDEDTTGLVVTYLGLGTGVGGESIKDGVICSRADGMLGEYGHIGIRLANGERTTLEKRVSGTAISRIYGDDGKRSSKEIGQDPSMDETWKTIGEELGGVIGSIAPLVGMKHVVIGGGVSRDHRRFDRALVDEIAKVVEPMPRHLVEEPPKVHYVSNDMIDKLGMLGAFLALEQRYMELA